MPIKAIFKKLKWFIGRAILFQKMVWYNIDNGNLNLIFVIYNKHHRLKINKT